MSGFARRRPLVAPGYQAQPLVRPTCRHSFEYPPPQARDQQEASSSSCSDDDDSDVDSDDDEPQAHDVLTSSTGYPSDHHLTITQQQQQRAYAAVPFQPLHCSWPGRPLLDIMKQQASSLADPLWDPLLRAADALLSSRASGAAATDSTFRHVVVPADRRGGCLQADALITECSAAIHATGGGAPGN